MKQENKQKISGRDSEVVNEFKRKVTELFPDAEIIFYGSKARGEGGEFSDLDLLVILKGKVTTAIEDKICDLGYDLELKYGVILGILVESLKFWESDWGKAMPLRMNVDREGVKI
jgi:predicted nucleotidyltransferase